MITNFFIPELNNHDVQELWFQQDGATCHTARATIDLLKDTFGDRLISRFGLVNWPPRSCDLTPLDYFLWGYVKSLVYVDKPQTLGHLEDNIRRVIANIRPQMLEKVIENSCHRSCFASSKKVVNAPVINTRLVYGMRQIGKGFVGAFKLCSTLNLPRLTKTAYKNQEAKLLKVVQEVAEESMIKAATEIVEKNKISHPIL
ncbi:transposable element Tc3 transposase [Trichonephila clavipes]|nr:transposable element Tc3 transposase [Trichonephila clavipes]